jgi:hypothetical protein
VVIKNRVADPYHFHVDLDPDTAFHFKADQDPAFHFNAEPDPAPHQNDAYLQPLVYRTSSALFFSIQASTVSFHGTPSLHFEPLKLLSFYFNANPSDTDPAFHTDAGPDPDPQPCSKK